MSAKEFFAKVILGSDIHKDLASAEKEVHEAQNKYDKTCQTISVLEEEEKVTMFAPANTSGGIDHLLVN